MRFWDSSAIVPLLVEEPTSQALRAEVESGSAMVVWWATAVECVSAIARRERESPGAREMATALATLEGLEASWLEVPPAGAVRADARRLVRVHDLRAADAFQLAAARAVADGEPAALPFVTLDERLVVAASREGFPVLAG